jgi:hypothetical protein
MAAILEKLRIGDRMHVTDADDAVSGFSSPAHSA